MEHRKPKAPATQVLREKLRGVLTEQQIDELCFDYFRPVYDACTRGMTKDEKVQLLIEYCDRECRLDELDRRIDMYRQPPARGPAPQRTWPTASAHPGLMAVLMAIVVLAFLASMVGILYVLTLFPRGPAPSATQITLVTATHTPPFPTSPTTVASPVPTTPVLAPTLTVGEAKPWFGLISFCLEEQVDHDRRCCKGDSPPYFSGNVTKVYASWSFGNVREGMLFSRRWYKDGEPLPRLNHINTPWTGNWRLGDGTEYTWAYPEGVEPGLTIFPTGTYRLELYIGEERVQVGEFKIVRQ